MLGMERQEITVLTITDTNNNTGENILRWLNYNLSLDATFEGKDPFYYPEMVIDNGYSSYETVRGVLYGSTSNVLAGVRVIDGNGIRIETLQGFNLTMVVMEFL